MTNGKWETCSRRDCGAQFYLPQELYDTANRSRGPKGVSFYCPYGHGMHYVESETVEAELRRERDRLIQRLAEKDDTINRERKNGVLLRRQRNAQRGVVTRIKRRIQHGVCPCCTRSFQNLREHMKTKHPDFEPKVQI